MGDDNKNNNKEGEEIDKLQGEGFNNMTYIEQQGGQDAKDAARKHVNQVCTNTSGYGLHMITQPDNRGAHISLLNQRQWDKEE